MLMKNLKLSLWSVLLICWTAYAFFYSEQLMSWSAAAGQPIGFREALLSSMAGWLTWVPFSMFLIRLVRRWPVEEGKIGLSICVLSAGALVVILGKGAYMYCTNPLFGWYDQLPSFWEVFLASVRNNFLLCWLIIGGAHALLYAERAQQRQQQIMALQSSLSRARLDALSAQLNPHFLFNTLNSIAELVHHDADASDRMLVNLSALLRSSLSRSSEQEVRLDDELELLSHYIDIQKVRLGRRLEFCLSIDRECLDAQVPPLILQPIVENAIVHAIARRIEGGRLEIGARKAEGRLQLEIANDGAPTDETRHGHGIGLRITRERLACLYGDAYRFEMTHEGDGRTIVRIGIPFRRAEAQPERGVSQGVEPRNAGIPA